MFQSTYSIGGQLNAGTSINGLQFAILAPRPLHTITNYDTNERFAVPGNTAESVTKGLHPNMNYKVRWFKDGKPVGEPVTMTSDEKGEFGSVPITVPTDLDKEAIYTSAVFPESSEADDITDCLYADSFLAKLQPSVKLHRNLNKDDQEVKTVDATAKATEEDKANNLVDLPVVRDDAEYKVDDTKDRYFVGWASTPDATEPDKNELVTEDYVKTHPNADIYVRDGSKYKIPAEKNTKDLYAVWKDPFTVKVKKEWTNTTEAYKTEGLKFGLLRRPAVGPYGHEVVSNAAIYKPLEGSMKDFNKDGMTWDKVPSYDAEGHRLSYVVVELATKEQQEAFAKGDKTWATYRANIIEKDEKNNNHPSKQQTVNLPKTSDGKLDSFTAATVRKHITKDGKELNPHGDGKDINVGYFDTVGYSIVATNKKIDIEPPTINQAKAGDQQVTISHKEEGIEEFKGTLTLEGKETPFSAKRDPQTNAWTVTDDKGNEIPGVSADNRNPSDNKLVLKTPVLKEGDSVKAIAVRRDVESPAAEMHVKDMKSKLPTHIKQEYSEDKDKAVVTAKIYTEEINGAETIMADPDTTYTLVDKDGKPVEGVAPVKANGTQIKFEIPKDKVKEGEEYFIQSAAPRKEPNDTRAVEGKASENGTPSDKSVKLDITAPKVEGDKLPTVSGFTDGEVSGTAKVTEPNGPVTVKDPAKAEEALPSGITLQGGKDAVKVSGHTPDEKIGPYKAILEDKFGNAAECPGEVRILAKVRDDIKDLTPEEQAKYSKVTFQSDDHSKLVKDGKEVTEIAKYILKDFNQDGKVDADDKITAHQAANAGLVEPTKKIEDKYIFKNWDPDFLSEGIDPSKDNTFKIVTELNDDASKYNPKGQDINTKVGENPNPEDGINNRYDLPKDAKYSFKNPVDTSKPGDVPAVVVVTYPDGSKDEVTVKVIVKEDEKKPTDADKYDPEGQDITVKPGEKPDPKDGIKNLDDLPDGTKVDFEKPVNTDKEGSQEVTIIVTYPDGSQDRVTTCIIVKKDSCGRGIAPGQPSGGNGVVIGGHGSGSYAPTTGDTAMYAVSALLFAAIAGVCVIRKKERENN